MSFVSIRTFGGALKFSTNSRTIPSAFPRFNCGFGNRENWRYSLTISFKRSSSFRTDRIKPCASSLEPFNSREPFRLNHALFHGAKIGTILEEVNIPYIVSLVDTLHRHVHDLPLVVAGQNENLFVQCAAAGIGLAVQARRPLHRGKRRA